MRILQLISNVLVKNVSMKIKFKGRDCSNLPLLTCVTVNCNHENFQPSLQVFFKHTSIQM